MAAFLTGGAVQANTIVDSNGFELPKFSTTYLGTGQLEGQHGWQRSAGPALGTAVVQTAVVYSGDQAVQIHRASNSDDRWAVSVTPLAAERIQIDWEMRVEDAHGGAYGPFFGVEAHGGGGLLGSLGVDATTRDVLFQAAGTGFLVETGHTITFGAWNHFRIVLDFSTREYAIYLNGSFLSKQGFVDSGPGQDTFTDAALSAIAAGGDMTSQAQAGTAYYDKFTVKQTMVSVLANIYTATEIEWPSEPGVQYLVQYTLDLSTPTWTNLGSPITATATISRVFDSTHATPRRYYRVVTIE